MSIRLPNPLSVQERFPGGIGGGADDAPTVESLTAELATANEESETAINSLNTLQTSIDDGSLVNAAIATQVEKGTLWDKKRYAPLQTKYNDALAEVDTLTKSAKTHQTGLDGVQATLDEKTTALDALTISAAADKAKTERLNLIVTEFPDLAPLEAKEALPQADDLDSMRVKFTALSETMALSIESGVEDRIAGSTSQPRGKQTDNEDAKLTDLKKQRVAAKNVGDWTLFDDLQEKIQTFDPDME